MADVDCDWEECEYQHDYNLPLIYYGKNRFIKCHCLTFPKGQREHKFTYRISRPIRRTMIFSLEILEKKMMMNVFLVIYWKKTGLLHTKISNHNIIYSSQKPRKSLSLPLKSSSLSHDKDVV
jgi:hypothetical protein